MLTNTMNKVKVKRILFDRSRERKKIANDADRLRKYLARFDLEWGELKARLPRT